MGVGCTVVLALKMWRLRLKLGKCFTQASPGDRGLHLWPLVQCRAYLPLIHMVATLEAR